MARVTPDEPSDLGASVRVDVHGVQDFAGTLARQGQDTLRPTAGQLTGIYSTGATFGQVVVSHNTRWAQQRYWDCLGQASELLDAHTRAVQVLVGAGERAALRYRDTDSLASATVDDIERDLSDGIVTARAARPSGNDHVFAG